MILRFFNRSLFLGCFVAISFTCNGQSESGRKYSDAIRFVDAWLEAQQAYDKVPGISVGIVKDQELIFSKGYGVTNLDKKGPATPKTLYSICSITKLFTAIAIMKLHEEGKLRLDDSLSAILPNRNIRQQFPTSGPITIRGLLTHSSGLPREVDVPYWSGPSFTFPSKDEVEKRISSQQTLYPASTYFQYSNLGMTLLGEVIEKISGRPYDVYIEETILEPLRMRNTFSRLPEELWGTTLATGYSSINRAGTRDKLPLFKSEALLPAIGYSSTVEDLAAFASWQFRLLSGETSEILESATLKEMLRVHWVDPDWRVHWGLGFSVFQYNGKTLAGHSGTCPGYRSILLIDPKEKLGFIVLTNAMENPWKYASHIRNILLKGDKEKKPKNVTVDLSPYVGTYNAQPWGSEKKVLSWFGNLAILDLPSDNPLEDLTLLQHVSGDVFRRIRRDDELGEEIRFERDARTGSVSRMWEHSNFSTKLK